MKAAIRKGGAQTRHGFLFELSGGDLSLDFVNTLDSRPAEHPHELLPDLRHFFSWCRQSGILSTTQENQLQKAAEHNSENTKRTLRLAIAARECLFQIFAHHIDRKPAPAFVLRRWNDLVQKLMLHCEFVAGNNSYRWQPIVDLQQMDSVLWPVIHAAIQLLTSPRLERVRRCAAKNCDWLFLDNSKRGNRRWCDMTVCGNRAKASRFYHRKKSSRKVRNVV